MAVYLVRERCYAIVVNEMNRSSEFNLGAPKLNSRFFILFEREESMPETDQLYLAVQSAGRLHEHTFNIEFGKVLAETDARWCAHSDEYILAERPGTLSSGRADVLIDDPQMPAAAIEASYNPADADRDAQARLGQNTTRGGRPLLAVLALHIPEEYKGLSADSVYVKLKDRSQQIGYALHQSGLGDADNRRWPAEGFIQGTVHDASRLIATAAMPNEVIDARSEEVAQLIKQAAETLKSTLNENAQRTIAGQVGQNSPLEGLRTTMVLWLNALLIQQRLQVQGVNGIPPVRTVSGVAPNPSVQVETWRRIIEINWRSIFKPAVNALAVCGDLHRAGTTEALRRLIEAVGVIEDADLGQHINVGAALFPKLASDRKESAAFYTQPATAELLASLTIRQSDKLESEWARSDLLRRSITADLACGTGTLLKEGYLRVKTLHEWAGGTEDSLAELHRGAMEFGLRGTDISPIAAHLTSSNLANIGKGESYGDTQIGWVKVGGVPAQTGALEYMAGSVAEDLFGLTHGSAGGVKHEALSVEMHHGRVDWVLMNPPYSRTRGGQSAFDLTNLTEEDRKRCQKRWKVLVKDEPANMRAGMAASFLVLAKHKVKLGTGRIGFVLPLTCAFADTWTKTRRMIEAEFADIVLIATASGTSLKHESFSADTGMEEMLLVATRREIPQERVRAVLHCVTLYKPCTRNGEAGEVARAIEHAKARCTTTNMTHPVTVGDSEIGCITMMHANGQGLPWNIVGVTHGGLALAADALTRGTLDYVVGAPIPLGMEMGTIEDVFHVGPTHHLIGHPRGSEPIGAFEFHPVTSEIDAIGTDRALWEACSKRQRSLRVLPTHKGFAPPGVGSPEQRVQMRLYANTLFYARNIRWTSQALLSAATEQPAFGGSTWTALIHGDVRVQKAFALWWNSTLGMIVHWTQGQRTQNGRSRTQIGALRKIPCPRLDRLSYPVLEMAATRFDALSNQALCPAKDAAIDPVRKEIDNVVSNIFEIHKAQSISEKIMSLQSVPDSGIRNATNILRKIWCAEPSVHGWKES